MYSEKQLAEKFPRMTPVKNAPPMVRVNGCGVSMYGKRDEDAETGAYVATWCIALLFAPIVALRAYRVARGDDGRWYFLGREPLSTRAKGLNLVVVAALLSLGGVIALNQYWESPGYKARQQMALAQAAAARGQVAQAAATYGKLALAGAEESEHATAALRGLLEKECRTAPLGESAAAYEQAVLVARRGKGIAAAEVLEKGVALAKDRGAADPRGGIAVLDTVRPLAVDTRAVDAERLTLLKAWAQSEPMNLSVVTPLAELLLEQGDVAGAKKLLMPVKDQLADTEGARVLGTVLVREQDYEGAYAILWPYVEPRLKSFHAAEDAAVNTEKRLWDEQVKALSEGKGPKGFYDKYKAASTDEQHALVREYVDQCMKDDPQYQLAEQRLEQQAVVVPAALELGMVMLQRAQALPDAAKRKEQLEATEQVFLAVRGMAGQTDQYRLSLGEVYYWVGKQAEGRKLFDELLASKGRSFTALMGISQRLRALGSDSESRAMSEEAYAKGASNEERYAAAELRALCQVVQDPNDEVNWLRKADQGDPVVKAKLANALGSKAYREGNSEEAVKQYRQALDAYAAMPRSAVSLNDMALVYRSIYGITGERTALERRTDYLQQAAELAPQDSVLLFNAGVTLQTAALADVIGSAIDLHALHAEADVDLLGYLYSDAASRAALVRRIREHPGIARSLGYLQKVMVLAPKNPRAYQAANSIYQFTRDDAALSSLEQRMREANIDTSDTVAGTKEFIAGKLDQQYAATISAQIKRQENLVDAMRTRGGPTAAAAIGSLVESLIHMDYYGGDTDPDRVVTLAEEANRLCPSSGSNGLLMTALFFRADKQLAQRDPAYREFRSHFLRTLDPLRRLVLAAGQGGSLQQATLQHPDVLRGIELLRAANRGFPDSRSPIDWAVLKLLSPGEAEESAAIVRKTPRRLLEHSIDSMLNPASLHEALDGYWLMQLNGRPEEAKQSLQRVAALGIQLPIQP